MPFYVKWAQDFVNFLPGQRLREDIDAFLAGLSKRPDAQDWQIRQTRHALKILYESFLFKCAPDVVTKPAAAPGKKKKAANEAPKFSIFRDRVVPGEVGRG